MKGRKFVANAQVAAALTLAAVAAAPVNAADPNPFAQPLDFNYKLNQGPAGTSFATLSIEESGGVTTFSLNTVLSGGQGNPGITELHFGCDGCGASFVLGPGVSAGAPQVQSGYDFDFRMLFDPSAVAGNTPLVWTTTTSASAFAAPVSGSGPDAFALIQLTGGMETINGRNIESGFYIAPVPEPSTYLMMLAGLGLVGLAMRRRTSA